MGTIQPRARKDGTTAYYAQIAVRHNGKQHREQKTFDRKAAAQAWIKRREYELTLPGAFDPKPMDAPLSEVIERYISSSRKSIGRTKAQVLQSIQRSALGAVHCTALRSTDIVAYAQELSASRQPQTVLNYLSHLGSVVAIAKPAWGYPLDAEQMADALKVVKRLGLTSKSRTRSRRPTINEMDRLMQHFFDVHARRPLTCPMHRVVAFALFSTRRQEEITRITWKDFDAEGSRVLVRDMKNPGQKNGNDVWCELPPEALAIVQAMPKRDARIFPFTTDAISASFTRACALLGIEDLHFHDLRHEGVSRLLEMGRTVPLAASVSGHRSWQSMQRYTHIQRRGDQWANWPWIDQVTG